MPDIRRPRRLPRFLAVAAASGTMVVTACASAAGTPGTGSTGSPRVIAVHDNANGKTISARVGDTVELTLSSSYWNVAGSSTSRVLRQDGAATPLPRPSDCPPVPGLGCVPIRVKFTALTNGTALIKASRTTCGEALKCVKQATRFTLTVIVRPA
jgi:hypothetical protein